MAIEYTRKQPWEDQEEHWQQKQQLEEKKKRNDNDNNKYVLHLLGQAEDDTVFRARQLDTNRLEHACCHVRLLTHSRQQTN